MHPALRLGLYGACFVQGWSGRKVMNWMGHLAHMPLSAERSALAWLERARQPARDDVLGFLRSCPSPEQSTQTWRWEHHSEGWVCGPARGTLRTYGGAAAWGGGAIMPPSQHACMASTCTAERRDISTTRPAWSAVQVPPRCLRVVRQTARPCAGELCSASRAEL